MGRALHAKGYPDPKYSPTPQEKYYKYQAKQTNYLPGSKTLPHKVVYTTYKHPKITILNLPNPGTMILPGFSSKTRESQKPKTVSKLSQPTNQNQKPNPVNYTHIYTYVYIQEHSNKNLTKNQTFKAETQNSKIKTQTPQTQTRKTTPNQHINHKTRIKRILTNLSTQL